MSLDNTLFNLLNAFPTKPWNWYYISCNPNITMEMINMNLDVTCAWNWSSISENPNFTMEMIKQYPDKFK